MEFLGGLYRRNKLSLLYNTGFTPYEQLPHTQRTNSDVAYIVWTVGEGIPLGTDTFIVRDGKIAQQTWAMHTQSYSQYCHLRMAVGCRSNR